MADNSSNNGSGTNNWRTRVGVKDSMPKLADEFKPDGDKPPAPRTEEPVRRPPAPAGQQRPAPKPVHRPVARPAPMAPRRPATTSTRPIKPPAPGAGRPVPRSADAPAPQANSFSERLRAQREAAEMLAKKRADETRARQSGENGNNATRQTSDGPKFSFADEELKTAETENAPAAQPTQPVRAPFQPVHSGSSGSVPRPYQPSDAYRRTHGYREYNERSEAGQATPQNATPRTPDQAPDRAPERTLERGAPAPAQGGHSNDDRVDQSGAQNQYAPASQHASASQHTSPRQGEYQVPRARGGPPRSEYYDDNSEDLFDDREALDGRRRSSRQRAGASDYSAAYQDYDEAFEYEEEPRGRGGIWIFVVLMLLVVAAIAAGAFWFINYGTKIGAGDAGNGAVPTVTAPQKPVKVEPKAVDTTTPGAPVRRKKIYDRILGNQTLEPEKLAPTEEAPKALPTPVIPEVAPTTQSPIGIEPLPLPLPPPPTVPGTQGSLSQKTNKVASSAPNGPTTTQLAQTTIAPTAAKQDTSTIQAGGQQPPLPLPGLSPPETGSTNPGSTNQGIQPVASQATDQVQQPTPEVQSAPPLPRKKPLAIIAQARKADEQRHQAAFARAAVPTAPAVPVAPRTALANNTGPVQLAPGAAGSQNFTGAPRVVPNTQAPIAPSPAPLTNIASLPQPVPQPTVPATTTGGGYVLQMSSFRNRNAASTEYRRLVTSHASILQGLSPEIREADLGASGKFYKLRLGSLPNRVQAARVCNSLIAAGEKDCLVRRR